MLTPRQYQVAQLVAKGHRSREIAREIGTSARTVEKHIEHAAARIGGDSPPRHRITIFVLQCEDPE